MSAPQYLRVWRGWKRNDVSSGDFLTALQRSFVPATWQVMRNFGLQCYMPSVLQADDSALPNEVALLFYSDQDAYNRAKTDATGQRYFAMHGDLFRFKDPTRPGSATAIGIDLLDAPPKTPALPAWWRRPTGAGRTLWDIHATASFVALRNGTAPVVLAQLLASLGHRDDEVVVFIDGAFTLVWVAGDDALDPQALAKLLAGAVGATVASAHSVVQQPLPPDPPATTTGAAIDWDCSVRFGL